MVNFFIDTTPSISTTLQVPGFPWVRADAGRFVWEEALFGGNYLSVHHSAMGRCQSKENIFLKLTRGRFPAEHLYAFELEVDGRLLRDGWEWRGTREQGDELIVELTYPPAGITVFVHTQIDGTPFLMRWLEIRNDGDRPVALSRVYPWAGMIGCEEEGTHIVTRDADRGFALGCYLNHAWGMEGEFAWQPLPMGTFSETTRGNKYSPPMYIVRNGATGELTVIHLECTFNTEAAFTRGTEAGQGPQRPWGGEYLYAKAGLGGKAPFRVLAPGETTKTPAVHVGMVYGDLDAAVTALHAHIRASVMPKDAPRANLVEYNHTGYTLNAQVSKELLRQEVDMAAEIGVELFLVDAGWFGPKDKAWNESVGDWTENPILGEDGLLEVFDYARGKGMKCGLWMPPEMTSSGVAIQQEHPDWFLPGASTFDVLNPAVEEYVYETICRAVERFKLDCYRIDGGSSDVGEGTVDGRTVNQSWRYYDVLYRIYERVKARFPHLIMENCSGGGGRSELSMLRRFHYTQITDNWNPADQIRILNGMTLALAPEQCMPLVGSINMRPAEIDFVIRTGMLGHFTASGVFPNVERANAPSLERWRHGIALYKEVIRPLLPTCRVFHHTPEQDFRRAGAWVVLEYAGEEAAVAGFFRLADSPGDLFPFHPRGLDPSRDYRVTFDNSGKTTRFSGAQLCTTGLPVSLPGIFTSELLIITAG